jgi:hypothetical protein
MMVRNERLRNASGFVWRRILRTSSGRRTTSPMPVRLRVETGHVSQFTGVDGESR